MENQGKYGAIIYNKQKANIEEKRSLSSLHIRRKRRRRTRRKEEEGENKKEIEHFCCRYHIFQDIRITKLKLGPKASILYCTTFPEFSSGFSLDAFRNFYE